MQKIQIIRTEEQAKYLKEQYQELKQNFNKVQDECDKKVNNHKLEYWKLEMETKQMAQNML